MGEILPLIMSRKKKPLHIHCNVHSVHMPHYAYMHTLLFEVVYFLKYNITMSNEMQ